MVKTGKFIGIVLTLFMVFSLQAMAGNGTQNCIQNGIQSQTQNGEKNHIRKRIHRICENGIPVTISGTVVEALYAGQGITVDTGVEIVTVYGFGPQFYWDDLGSVKPSAGEETDIEALEVTFSDGSTRIFATRVTIGDDVITLRDENCVPLWRPEPKTDETN